MSFVVMVQSEAALKEFVLPAVNDSDYRIILNRNLFQLQEDIEVLLEVVGNKWHFLYSEVYSITNEAGIAYQGNILSNGDLYILTNNEQKVVSLIIIEMDTSFQIMQKIDISQTQEIFIGTDSVNNIQYRLFNFISRNHAALGKSQQGWSVFDSSQNGTFLNNKRVNGNALLKFGDCINIFGLKMVFLGNVLAVSLSMGKWTVTSNGLSQYYIAANNNHLYAGKEGDIKKYFKRSPRYLEEIYTDDVEIEAPPTLNKQRSKPAFMVIGPSFTMAIPMLLGTVITMIATRMNGGTSPFLMLTGIITALGSAVVGVFWAKANLRYEKEIAQENEENRYNSYGQYLIGVADELKEKYEKNFHVMNSMYPSGEVYVNINGENPNLWNRNNTHNDFLTVRVGIGNIPFQVKINTPKNHFTMNPDDLIKKPEELKRNYSILYDVPVTIDLLKHKMIGIVGGQGKIGALPIMINMVEQIAVNNCYTDVKLVFIYTAKTEEDCQQWEFAKWLPHVWSEDKRCRYIANDRASMSDMGFDLAKVLRARAEECDTLSKKPTVKPYYIVFVENMELLEGELVAKYIMNPQDEYGITTILMVDNYEDLPNECEEIIQNDGHMTSIYNVNESSSEIQQFMADKVQIATLEKMARNLSGVEVAETDNGGEIPNSLDFFEMYGVDDIADLDVLERWTKHRTYESMRALIGKKGGNADCYLDIHEKYHGPHGLIAGTTGSGKSETLQTYMLSLAVEFSPYDVVFFIIDYKGGGMANLFSGLPHLIGQISNLSGNQVQRAMISIKSENRRRQRIFSEHSVNNINLYTRLYKNGEATEPVPHLFIIIDEFAELKREEPEFMKELISVAQVGRSLGVHLILATQKPSGTVDDNIWSNTKFRLCLRVADRQDSNDMLHKPDAAYITQAGRGYLQVGSDEVYELFQSGYSGAIYDTDSSFSKSIAQILTLTGKTAVVGNRLKKEKKETIKRQWLECLYNILLISLKDLEYEPIALVDGIVDKEVLLRRIFDNLANAGEEYEESEYNKARLVDFIEICADILKSGILDIDVLCEEADAKKIKLPEQKEKTQLDAIVEYLSKLAKENNYKQIQKLWLPVLSNNIFLEDVPGYSEKTFDGMGWKKEKGKWSLETVMGIYDDPENQAQLPITLDFSECGHLAVMGTVVTGKSTFLQTLIYAMIMQYSPQELNVYVLDFSSRMLSAFEEAPHVGGVMYDSDEEKIAKFFNLLIRIMDERKTLLRGGNYTQYVKVNGVVIPAIMLVIDNISNFREKTGEAYDDVLNRLSREGVGYGIYLVVSAAGWGMSEIPSRMGDNIKTVMAFDMGDRFKLAETLRMTRVEIMPEADIKGRGLAIVEGRLLEFQTALAVEASDDFERVETIKQKCKLMNENWEGKRARPIPVIPEKPVLSNFIELDDYKNAVKTREFLPIAYYMEDASVYSIDLSKAFCYAITGRTKTGKTNVLKNAIVAASYKTGAEIHIIETDGCDLQKTAMTISKENENLLVDYLSSQEEIFEFFKRTIPEFRERNQIKQSLLERDMETDEIYNEISNQKQIFIFIADIVSFVKNVYKPLENGTTMYGYIENIISKGALHNFHFIGCVNLDKVSDILGMPVYEDFVSYKMGVHLGGNLDSQRIFSFGNIPYMEQTKSMKIGTGIVPSYENMLVGQTIVLPLAKGV